MQNASTNAILNKMRRLVSDGLVGDYHSVFKGLEDAETGELVELDTGDATVRARFHEQVMGTLQCTRII